MDKTLIPISDKVDEQIQYYRMKNSILKHTLIFYCRWCRFAHTAHNRSQMKRRNDSIGHPQMTGCIFKQNYEEKRPHKQKKSCRTAIQESLITHKKLSFYMCMCTASWVFLGRPHICEIPNLTTFIF